jgi:hypothetical protein
MNIVPPHERYTTPKDDEISDGNLPVIRVTSCDFVGKIEDRIRNALLRGHVGRPARLSLPTIDVKTARRAAPRIDHVIWELI